MARVTRRSFVTTLGAATVVPGSAWRTSPAREAPATSAPPAATQVKTVYLFFNDAEAEFIEAACERLIPADEPGTGALRAAVPDYLDKHLDGAWGAGESLYRSGPWQVGTPSPGHQLLLTPAELFHTALHAINSELERRRTPFFRMSTEAQDAFLTRLQAGDADLDGVPSRIFFEMLLQMTVEGFFSHPVHGGERDMVSWQMNGFPGAYASQRHVGAAASTATAPR